MRSNALVFAALVFLAGCGPNLKPLDSAQKDQLRSTLDSFGRVQRAIGIARQQQSSRSFPLVGGPTDPMADRLIRQGCRIDGLAQNGARFDLGLPDFSLRVWGDSANTCPIDLSFTIRSEMGRSGVRAILGANYTVRDTSFEQLNDIVGASLQGSSESSFSDGKASGTSHLDGALSSRTQGRIEVIQNAQMQVDAGSSSWDGNRVSTFRFTGFTAELREVARLDRAGLKLTYTLNGLEIPREDFLDYVHRASFLFSLGRMTAAF